MTTILIIRDADDELTERQIRAFQSAGHINPKAHVFVARAAVVEEIVADNGDPTGILREALRRCGASDATHLTPQQCALLAVEWEGEAREEPHCPLCDGEWDHKPGCLIDAALTDSGLETQKQRFEARKGA